MCSLMLGLPRYRTEPVPLMRTSSESLTWITASPLPKIFTVAARLASSPAQTPDPEMSRL